jgi:hypothetical protein
MIKSLLAQSGRLGELNRDLDLARDPFVERLRRHDHRRDAELGEPCLADVRFEPLHGDLMDSRDDIARRLLGREHSDPEIEIGIRETRFDGGWNVRQRRDPLGAAHSER